MAETQQTLELTKAAIDAALKPGSKSCFIPPEGKVHYLVDSKVQGLRLRIMPSSTAAFMFAARIKGVRVAETIGRYPHTSLQSARDRTNAILAARGQGVNLVAQEEQQASAQAQAEAEQDIELTFEQFIPEYFARHADLKREKKSVKSDRASLANLFPPQWMGRKLSSFTNPEMCKLHSDITASTREHTKRGRTRRIGGPTAANRFLALLRHMFNRAIKWGMLAGANPARLDGEDLNKVKTVSRVFSSDEMQRLAAELDREPLWAGYFRITAALGTRRNELLAARWENVDFNHDTIGLVHTKNGKAFTLRMGRVREVVEEIASRGKSDWLFPSAESSTGHLVGASQAWDRIKKRAGITGKHAGVHCLRHTYATAMASQGYTAPEIMAALNHGSLAISQRYINSNSINLAKSANDRNLPSL
jgi:integrase